MIPSHCKVVGKLRLRLPITEENLRKAFEGKRAYKLTEFYCVTDGRDWAVMGVRKAEGPRLLLPIEDVEVLSLPHETCYVEDPRVDTTNPTAMLQVADAMAPDVRAVVVQGEFNHLSFVLREGEEVRVRVLDVVPPYPSKVLSLARRGLECRPLPVLLEEESVDLVELAMDLPDSARLVFPCRASGLELDRWVEYLDETPEMGDMENLVLVGCTLSERIFKERYGRPPPRTVTMCPLELAKARGEERWTLVKCCQEKGPFGVHGRVVAIPWSASRGDAATALEEIVRRERSGTMGGEGT